ncbi:glycosyltransferase family 2 protein [Pedobacter agri]|uniref:glycosyltransferase family 2 protein n=1 Tax=Pedobacter agri TaxID=454586 RepID=UPI0027864465|nr:glycosyltransferase family 2 protein [Pedobacter agri]MDQ1141195.1 GT2 family glycosyltransferase [Pedobacter agri]
MDIAILLATFNRKEKTLSCLKSLSEQELNPNVKLNVFLTDDNSKDGTAEAVQSLYPHVNVLAGTGNLFWAGGMRNSWRKALEIKADYYLLLNDDTLLSKDCISRLLKYYSLGKPDAITVGSTMNPDTKLVSYGGHKLFSSNKVTSHSVFSETDYLECDMANGNIMFVPSSVVEKIGILSETFTHSIADFDYVLRAKKANIKTVVVPGILGYCVDDNLINETIVKRNLKQRIAHLKSPKGLAYKEYMMFISTHFPSHRLEAFLKIWLRTLFPSIWHKLNTGRI